MMMTMMMMIWPVGHLACLLLYCTLNSLCAWLYAACLLAQDVDPCSSLGTEEQLVLPGYGVEAVLKNMEYSAMDDKSKADAAAAAKAAAKKAKKAAAEGGAGGELADVDLSSLGEVKGFKFDVLAQRKPHLVQELMTFRDVLMSNDEEEAIKVSVYIGLHGCQRGVAWVVPWPMSSCFSQAAEKWLSLRTTPAAAGAD